VSQRKKFLDGEGDQWFQRNRAGKGTEGGYAEDPVLEMLCSLGFCPRRVLEIGCSDGGRLQVIQETFGAECSGVEPSQLAVEAGLKRGLDVRQGTADELPFADGEFDLVILGFFLYLVDRGDLFKIAAETDRVVSDDGIVAVYDFYSPVPYRNPYQHRSGLFSYKMDYSRMFGWNPAYTVVGHRAFDHAARKALAGSMDDQVAVTMLRKDDGHAYIGTPFAEHS